MGEIKPVKAAMRINDTIGEMMLSRNTPKMPAIIIVEGEFDKKFIKSFCKDETEIIIGNNKYVVENAIIMFPDTKDYKKYVIGICDRDYEKPKENDQLFYYDYCNLEMMICANQTARTKLFKNAPENVELYDLLSELKLRSCLRKLSIEKNLNLDIKRYRIIDYHKVYNTDNIWDTQFFSDYKSEIVELSRKYETDEQLLYITQGHNFRHLFGIYIKEITHRDTSKKAIDEIFLSAFGKEELRKTILYGKITTYSKQNDIYFLIDF
jgi:hypothetical protein